MCDGLYGIREVNDDEMPGNLLLLQAGKHQGLEPLNLCHMCQQFGLRKIFLTI